ncbi:hypothetical protein BDBG_02767 [Blastomyces gilchristii SLH14081]|uniref:Uncharacterized protein n=1 Tax=Blastomyces gilchristii (strain SLH14081) TaxID=559298 RepID=A0A179UFH4_BLAGS|nr:uncharacterized protein BDBG_02767 [Blastomyces gilchristii SLH14081]OAT06580.1 hypothetical protein BDBG_02767 [Blastomyces gilchristii SLH14081]
MKSSRSHKISTAKHSSLTSVTVLPTNSATYHPVISHSHLYGITLDSLSPATAIRHTFIRHSTVKSNKSTTDPGSSNINEGSSRGGSGGNGMSTISQSHVSHCTISGSNIDCCSMRRTTTSNAEYVSGSQVRGSTILGTGRISQSKLKNAQFLCTSDDNSNNNNDNGNHNINNNNINNNNNSTIPNPVTNTTKTEVNKGDIRDSIVGPLPCTISRSRLNNVKISQSTVKDACLNDCDIDGCRIAKAKFSGLWLRNGIWEDGELVGKVNEGEEVIVKARNFAEIEAREREQERERVRGIKGLGIGVGIGVMTGPARGIEDPVSASVAAGRCAQGDNALPEIISGEASDSRRRLQDDDMLANPPQIPPPHFDSLLPTAAAAAAADDEQRSPDQQTSPPLSKDQPYISTETYPSSPSTERYSSAAESLLDPDEDGEFTLQDLPDIRRLGIDDEKPPPYTP